MNELTDFQKSLKDAILPERKEEFVYHECENCGEQAYGCSWYGKGEKTNDPWGDTHLPTGKVFFCKSCLNEFKIGKEFNGEEIWKTTSDREEYKDIRESYVKYKSKENVGFNACREIIERNIERCHLSEEELITNFPDQELFNIDDGKYIEGYGENYTIYPTGHIWSSYYNKFLKQAPARKGYLKVWLTNNGKVKSHFVHRLVAKTFIPNPKNKKTVNHIDNNKKNNNVDNLEWATQSENSKHYFKHYGTVWNKGKRRVIKDE